MSSPLDTLTTFTRLNHPRKKPLDEGVGLKLLGQYRVRKGVRTIAEISARWTVRDLLLRTT